MRSRFYIFAVLACACAALVTLASCANGSSSAASKGSSIDLKPKMTISQPPTFALSKVEKEGEEGEEGGSAMQVTIYAQIANIGDMPVTSLNGTTFTLLNAEGKPVRATTKADVVELVPGAMTKTGVTMELTDEEYEAFDSLSVSFLCPLKVFSCEGKAKNVKSVRSAKAAFVQSEEQQARQTREEARQAHIAAWHARFPTDDYSNTTLIGDSIMDNSSVALREALPGVDLNVDSGRSLEVGGLIRENQSPDMGVLDHIRRDDGSFDRYVIGTGNNDPGGMTIEDAEEMIEHLGPDKEIYFVTEMVTSNQLGTDTTNATIDAMVEKYPNVHKIDWHGLVLGHESEYLADWCHPRPSRYGDYAACIKEGLDVVY